MFPILFILLIPIVILTVITLVYICIGLFLDETYRPNIPQYPFNILLDRILPLIMIFMPTIIILYINPGVLSWMQKFGCIIIIHTTILAPIMYYWSKHRQWSINMLKLRTWHSPQIYLDITLL